MNFVYIIAISIFLLFPFRAFSQDGSDTNATTKFSDRIPVELEIEVKVAQSVPIGYAYCFKGQVLNVVRGILHDTDILITVMAGDSTNLNILKNSGENSKYKLFLMHNGSNEIYHTAYITGFVDTEKNSWKIVAIQKL